MEREDSEQLMMVELSFKSKNLSTTYKDYKDSAQAVYTCYRKESAPFDSYQRTVLYHAPNFTLTGDELSLTHQ